MLAPYAHPDVTRELEDTFGCSAEALHAETLASFHRYASAQDRRLKGSVWVRDRNALDSAAWDELERLRLVHAVAGGVSGQQVLDEWVSTATLGLMRSCTAPPPPPGRVLTISTVAVDDRWQAPADEVTYPLANGQAVPGFRQAVAADQVRQVGDTIIASLLTAGGMVARFAVHPSDIAEAERALNGDDGGRPVDEGHPLAHTVRAPRSMEGLTYVMMPACRLGYQWTVTEADLPVLFTHPDPFPALGRLPVAGMRQDGMVEFSHRGLRAAAVTAMLARGAPSRNEWVDVLQVRVDRQFAFTIEDPAGVRWFEGRVDDVADVAQVLT